jgi:hypothetical protein
MKRNECKSAEKVPLGKKIATMVSPGVYADTIDPCPLSNDVLKTKNMGILFESLMSSEGELIPYSEETTITSDAKKHIAESLLKASIDKMGPGQQLEDNELYNFLIGIAIWDLGCERFDPLNYIHQENVAEDLVGGLMHDLTNFLGITTVQGLLRNLGRINELLELRGRQKFKPLLIDKIAFHGVEWLAAIYSTNCKVNELDNELYVRKREFTEYVAEKSWVSEQGSIAASNVSTGLEELEERINLRLKRFGTNGMKLPGYAVNFYKQRYDDQYCDKFIFSSNEERNYLFEEKAVTLEAKLEAKSVPQKPDKLSFTNALDCTDVSLISIGSRVAIYWDGDDQYYTANVTKYKKSKKKSYYVEYDDGDSAWLDFKKERFQLMEDKRENCFQLLEEKSNKKLKLTNEEAKESALKSSNDLDEAKEAAITKYVLDRGGSRVIKTIIIADDQASPVNDILAMKQWSKMELSKQICPLKFIAVIPNPNEDGSDELIDAADDFLPIDEVMQTRLNWFWKTSDQHPELICSLIDQYHIKIVNKNKCVPIVTAIWPGYGQYLESHHFSKGCELKNYKCIGPSYHLMSIFTENTVTANILAQSAKLPTIPWSGSFGGINNGPVVASLDSNTDIPEEVYEKAITPTLQKAITAANMIGYGDGIKVQSIPSNRYFDKLNVSTANNESELRNIYGMMESLVKDPTKVCEDQSYQLYVFQTFKSETIVHVFVPFVGDEHGNAFALGCPYWDPQDEIWKNKIQLSQEMEKQMVVMTVRLAQSVMYSGIGTVTFIHLLQTNQYYFLKLVPSVVTHNNRKYVDVIHRGFNLPATQLQVAMGIPLHNIPDVRRFFGEDPYGNTELDFLTENIVFVDCGSSAVSPHKLNECNVAKKVSCSHTKIRPFNIVKTQPTPNLSMLPDELLMASIMTRIKVSGEISFDYRMTKSNWLSDNEVSSIRRGNISSQRLYANDFMSSNETYNGHDVEKLLSKSHCIELSRPNFLAQQRCILPSSNNKMPHVRARNVYNKLITEKGGTIMNLKTHQRIRRNGNTHYGQSPTIIHMSIPSIFQQQYLECKNKCLFYVHNDHGLPLLSNTSSGKHQLVQIELSNLHLVRMKERTETEEILVVGNFTTACYDTSSEFICWIASARECSSINRTKWNTYIQLLKQCNSLKPNVNRGSERNGIQTEYFCFGYRKEPKSTKIGKYVCKKNIKQDSADNADNVIQDLVWNLQGVTSAYYSKLSELKAAAGIRKMLGYPSMTTRGLETQFSVSKNYMSQVHTDDDYMFTTLAVCCENKNLQELVLYHFCFPTYNVSVPLYHGSVIVFDPKVPHCASNPSFKDCYIMSTYVSQKVVNTHVAESVTLNTATEQVAAHYCEEKKKKG